MNTPTIATPGSLPEASPTPLEAALAGLAISRQRLRQALKPPEDADAGALDAQGRPRADAWPLSLAGWWRRGRRALKAWPVADLAAGLLQDWWQHHPWRRTGGQLAETARQALLPLVRRHPLSALLGALGLGAALMAGRAWCWPAVRAIRPAVSRRGRRWLIAQLTNPTVQTALISAVMLVIKQVSAQRATSEPTPGAVPTPTTTGSASTSPMASPVLPPSAASAGSANSAALAH